MALHGEVGITGECHRVAVPVWRPKTSGPVSTGHHGLRALSMFIGIFTEWGFFVPGCNPILVYADHDRLSNEVEIVEAFVLHHRVQRKQVSLTVVVPTVGDYGRRVTLVTWRAEKQGVGTGSG